ncbi:MAG: radical SAM family heme chaperone HemW [Steroidobacteraceae bacterium]
MTVLENPPLALYVHFPWCVRKCPYCDFNSYTLRGPLAEDAYLAALRADLEAQAIEVSEREVISIFLGGGTPSLFSPGAIGEVLTMARERLRLAAGLEVTLEANPGTIERGRFAEYRAAGITRVSLGAQSFDAGRLAALGRIHSPDETRRAAEELHAAGLGNFNLDLMYGLPGQDAAGAVRDIDSALALAPAHLSHYQLTLEPGTQFAGRPPALPEEEQIERMLAACGERLAAEGLEQYEVSAYARPGRQCRHNLNYWRFGDYLGIGAGAHGKLTRAQAGQVLRSAQPREPRRYLACAARGAAARQAVPAEQLPFEFMLNVLRLREGFEPALFSRRTGLPWESLARPLGELMARELIMRDGARYRASPLGWRFLNELLLGFLPETRESVG